MMSTTVLPRRNVLQRKGMDNTLMRVLSVNLNDNVSCTGKPLHQVNAVRVTDGSPVFWFVSDAEAKAFGWL